MELKSGMEVLVPATIRECIGSGTVTVETRVGNHIVEYSRYLTLAAPQPAAASSEAMRAACLRVADEVGAEPRMSRSVDYYEGVVAGAMQVRARIAMLRLAPADVEARVAQPRYTAPADVEARVEARVEFLARVVCAADGVDPHQRATVFPVTARGTGFVCDTTVEAWRLYAKYVRALVDAGLA